ncbi:hypothetical protein [Modestobacter sp. SYSU DS0290]
MKLTIEEALWSGEREPAKILERVRESGLNERERELSSLNARLEDQVAQAVRDREDADRQRSEPALGYALELGHWGEVLAEGVVGGAGFALVAAAARNARERLAGRGSLKRSGLPPANEVLNSYVKIAVVEQCRRHGLSVPLEKNLHISHWRHDHVSSTAFMKRQGRDGFEVTVVVPHADLATRGASVLIVDSSRGESRSYS